MVTSKFLELGNPRRVANRLDGVLNEAALETIELELRKHSTKLYSFSLQYYRFAIRQSGFNWRQKISRLYYSSYSASRAIRLYVSGYYSQDVNDHKKIGNLPADFPKRAFFGNMLSTLRDDRNTCDYDHTSTSRNLVMDHKYAEAVVRNFLEETRTYLIDKGLKVRGRP